MGGQCRRSMGNGAAHMSDYLTHLRFVHNVQTIICLTIIYFVWSSWTSGTELLGELNRFLQTSELVREAVESRRGPSYLLPGRRTNRNSIRNEIFNMTGLLLSVNAPATVRSLTTMPDESAPIGVQWEALHEQEWLRQWVGTERDSLTDVGRWLNERWSPCSQHLRLALDRQQRDPRRLERLRRRDPRAELPRDSRLTGSEINRITTPEIYLTVAGWLDSADTITALVEVVVLVPQSFGFVHSCRGAPNNVPDAGEFTEHDEWELFAERKSFGYSQFPKESEVVRLPESTFDGYFHLERELDAIAEFTPTAALEWALDQQVAGIQDRQPRFFGTTIRGEHLGYVGPWATLLLQLYLLINLWALMIQVQKGSHVPDVVPWLPAIKKPLPIIFSSITLAVLPSVAAGLALWRLTPTSLPGLVIWSAGLSFLGMGAIFLALRLGAYIPDLPRQGPD